MEGTEFDLDTKLEELRRRNEELEEQAQANVAMAEEALMRQKVCIPLDYHHRSNGPSTRTAF